jgi:hypothetical protein
MIERLKSNNIGIPRSLGSLGMTFGESVILRSPSAMLRTFGSATKNLVVGTGSSFMTKNEILRSAQDDVARVSF